MSKRRQRRRQRRRSANPYVRTSAATCDMKMGFTSPDAATKYVRRSRFGNRLVPYLCTRCHLWHLTGGRRHT